MPQVIDHIKELRSSGKKVFALLIDPDKWSSSVKGQLSRNSPDLVLLGGSVLNKNDSASVLNEIKSVTDCPVFWFPGDGSQVCQGADGILLLSLISGRNPHYLIGQHVNHAKKIKSLDIEIWPTGYILLDGGVKSAVETVSNTAPISVADLETIESTAIAAELLGMNLVYLEAGSGAFNSVPLEIVRSVKSKLDGLLCVGGGLTNTESIKNVWDAGADIVVVGNGIENNPELLPEIIKLRNELNSNV